MDLYPIKPRLLELLQLGRKELLLFVDGLSDAGREEVGARDRWSPKDVFAHVLSWQRRSLDRLDAALTGGAPPPLGSDDVDEINAGFWAEHHAKSWEALLDESRRLYQEVSEKVSQTPEADLSAADRFPWLEGESLWMSVANNALVHTLLHLFTFYSERGDLQGMERQIGTMEAGLKGFEDQPGWRGLTLYNLACLHALTGAPRKALTLLPEALHLRPDLKPFAREDPDLSCLHQEPSFLRLVAAEGL